MDDEQRYIAAIQHVNHAVAHSDPAEWWPRVDRTPSRTTYLIDGEKYTFGHDRVRSHQDISLGSAYIRLLKRSVPCTLYATYNTKNLRPLDVIVGYVDDTTIVPAWDGRCVFPWIGGVSPRHDSRFEFVVCAALDTEYRRAVSFYNQRTRDVFQTTPACPTVNERLTRDTIASWREAERPL